MRDYVLSSETFNDLPFSYLEENNVKYIGARYTIGDTEYTAATKQDLDCKTFYDRLRKGEMPHTTQVGVEEATNMFEQIVAQGKDVLHIAFSSGLSGTCQAFRIAADEVMERHPECNIRVIDSLSASMGQGLMVEYCIRQKKAGMEMTALADLLEQERQHFIHMFTVDDLSHLHRGGRVSKLSAIVGGALGIKPILHVDENGKLIPIGKVRGRKQSLTELAAYMEKNMTGLPICPFSSAMVMPLATRNIWRTSCGNASTYRISGSVKSVRSLAHIPAPARSRCSSSAATGCRNRANLRRAVLR